MLPNKHSTTVGDSVTDERPRTPAQIAIGDFSPKLVDLTDQVLFGDIWERPGLSKRDRSLITVASLIALCRTEQLPGHLRRALENEVKREELIEVITHLAFYSGWPTAMSAIKCAQEIFKE
jgi:4-carboxymuconolactone decarboxylase